MKFFRWTLPLLFVFACGENRPGNRAPAVEGEIQQLSGAEFLILEKGTLVSKNEGVSGTGKIIFKDARPEEDGRYSLSFTLQDQGSLTLSTNANATLEGGFNFTFKREGERLKVEMNVGSEKYDLSSDFTSVQAAGAMYFEIEIHAHGHVLTWLGTETLEYTFSTKIPGRLWGLNLKDANVTKAQAGKATQEG